MFRAQDDRWRREGQHAQASQPRPRLSSEEARAGASLKVTFGPNDHAQRFLLEASFRRAQQQATSPLVAEQAEQTAQFIERAKKRLTSAEEWAQDWRSECATELHEAELRLEIIRAEAAEPLAAPPAPPDWEAEVMRLRQQVVELQCQRPLCSVQASHHAQLVEERASKRRACGEEVLSTEQALAEWLCTKHLELRDALEIGDPSVVAEPQGPRKCKLCLGPFPWWRIQ